jgi:hypothetical protein
VGPVLYGCNQPTKWPTTDTTSLIRYILAIISRPNDWTKVVPVAGDKHIPGSDCRRLPVLNVRNQESYDNSIILRSGLPNNPRGASTTSPSNRASISDKARRELRGYASSLGQLTWRDELILKREKETLEHVTVNAVPKQVRNLQRQSAPF